MDVKCCLCNQQVVAAEQKRTQRIGRCSFAGYQNLVEGNMFLCKNTMEMVKRTMKDFKNRVQELCFTLNRSERGPSCLKTHKALPSLFFAARCFRTASDIRTGYPEQSGIGDVLDRSGLTYPLVLVCLCQVSSYRVIEGKISRSSH